MEYLARSDEIWETALKAGCRLVNRSGLPGSVDDDLRRGRLTAVALLMGASDCWLQDLLMENREDLINIYVQQRLH